MILCEMQIYRINEAGDAPEAEDRELNTFPLSLLQPILPYLSSSRPLLCSGFLGTYSVLGVNGLPDSLMNQGNSNNAKLLEGKCKTLFLIIPTPIPTSNSHFQFLFQFLLRSLLPISTPVPTSSFYF